MSDAHERVVQQVREAIPPSYLYQADGYLFRAIEAMVRHIDELEAREGAYGRDVERQVAYENAQKLEAAEARIRELEAQSEHQWPTTVLELNKRITALQMKLEATRVRDDDVETLGRLLAGVNEHGWVLPPEFVPALVSIYAALDRGRKDPP